MKRHAGFWFRRWVMIFGAINLLNIKIFKSALVLLAPVFSGVLLIFAFPNFEQGWIAWLALTPLMIVLSGRRSQHGFLLAYICGIIFFTGVFNWILEVPGYELFHHTILILYLGLYVGIFGLIISFLVRRWGLLIGHLSGPFVWVSLEFIRSNLSFLALPWALLAHSQYLYPSVIQIAALTGTYSISFLIVMVNSTLTIAILTFTHQFKSHQQRAGFSSPRGRAICTLVATLVLTGLVFYYGLHTISRQIEGKGIKVTVVQGNIEQSKKWNPKFSKYIIKTYADLTRAAAEQAPDLIVWPETATPRAINQDRRLYQQVRSIVSSSSTYVLLGSAMHQKFKQKRRQHRKIVNSAYLIHPGNEDKDQRHDKIRLFPFGEYIPMAQTIPWSWINVPDMSNYSPGEEFTVFEANNSRFSVIICWEIIFPDLTRQFVKKGAQFIVNIANEAWFGKTASPRQFLSISVFRAVENRVYVVRCVNTGISCFIDPYGRIIDRVKDEKGRDLFVRGILTETVVPMDSKTLYTRYGDWFCGLSIGISAAFLIVAFLRRKMGKTT